MRISIHLSTSLACLISFGHRQLNILKSTASLILAFTATLSLFASHGACHDKFTTATLLERTQEEFLQDRVGIMIRWGVHSVLCDGESAIKDRKIAASDYEHLAKFFDGPKFRAAEWVKLAKTSGMRFITFTARTPDGFAMWDSKVNDWNVVKRTPLGRDVMQELSQECYREGLKLYACFSEIDWRDPALSPASHSTSGPAEAEGRAWEKYLDSRDAQLREVLMNYEWLHGVWLDGSLELRDADWRHARTYDFIKTLRPTVMIGNHHGRSPMPGEHFRIRQLGEPEPVPGVAETSTAKVGHLPEVIYDSINDSWGCKISDREVKPVRTLVNNLVRAVGADANFVISIGPMPNGQFSPDAVLRLREIGMWLAKNGESIYATRRGPVLPQSWGATTRRGNKAYVHVLDSETTSVTITPPRKVRSARYLAGEAEAEFRDEGGTVTLALRPELPGEMDRIVVLETN